MNAKENKKTPISEPPAPEGGPAIPPDPARNPPKPERAAGGAAAPEAGSWTPEQVAEWKTKADKADEHWDRLLRATADLENFKKRAARERQDAVRFANTALLEKLIPALDNLDMALAAADSAEAGSVESLRTGITMICNQLKSVLTEAGLEEINAAGRPFDPNLHEAVSQQESAEVPEGQVLQQLRKGYRLRERLIRPASVVVARKPGA